MPAKSNLPLWHSGIKHCTTVCMACVADCPGVQIWAPAACRYMQVN